MKQLDRVQRVLCNHYNFTFHILPIDLFLSLFSPHSSTANHSLPARLQALYQTFLPFSHHTIVLSTYPSILVLLMSVLSLSPLLSYLSKCTCLSLVSTLYIYPLSKPFVLSAVIILPLLTCSSFWKHFLHLLYMPRDSFIAALPLQVIDVITSSAADIDCTIKWFLFHWELFDLSSVDATQKMHSITFYKVVGNRKSIQPDMKKITKRIRSEGMYPTNYCVEFRILGLIIRPGRALCPWTRYIISHFSKILK